MNVTERTVDQYEAMYARHEAIKAAELRQNAEHTADIRMAVTAMCRAEARELRRRRICTWIFRLACAVMAVLAWIVAVGHFDWVLVWFVALIGFGIGYAFTQMPARQR